jgi:diguanylate cyclase (GGDEF)-like protein
MPSFTSVAGVGAIHRGLTAVGGRLVFVIALAMLALRAGIDFMTGIEVSFSVFYLIPVCLCGWYCGLSAGIAMSFLSAVTLEMVNHIAGLPYSAIWIAVWNVAAPFGFYVLVSYLLDYKRAVDERLEVLSNTDPMTGLAHRRTLIRHLEAEIERQSRTGRPLSLAFVDLDYFKALNDTRGHAAGDEALKVVAETFRAQLRKTDLAARLGGDEFAVVLPETDGAHAEQLLARLREKLLAAMRTKGWKVTFSIGVAHGIAAVSADTWLGAADALMYRAKREGRDAILLGPNQPAG